MLSQLGQNFFKSLERLAFREKSILSRDSLVNRTKGQYFHQTHRRFVRAFAQIVTALCAVGLAYGQGFGTIVGTLTDPAGAVIPGAKIKITDDATAISRETSANDQ